MHDIAYIAKCLGYTLVLNEYSFEKDWYLKKNGFRGWFSAPILFLRQHALFPMLFHDFSAVSMYSGDSLLACLHFRFCKYRSE